MKTAFERRLIRILIFSGLILSEIGCKYNAVKEENKYALLYSQEQLNGRLERQVFVRDFKDTMNKYVVVYFIGTKNVKESYYLHNGKKNGLQKLYYDNQKLKEQGEWVEGKRIGLFHYYSKDGWLNCIREFVLFSGDDKGFFLNRVYTFNENGDTLKSRSSYYTLFGKDTIQYGDTYNLKVFLNAPINKMSGFTICDYDSIFNLKSENACDTVLMTNYRGDYITSNYKKGDNAIRGMIYDFDEIVNISGDSITRGRAFYFTKVFYVK